MLKVRYSFHLVCINVIFQEEGFQYCSCSFGGSALILGESLVQEWDILTSLVLKTWCPYCNLEVTALNCIMMSFMLCMFH